MKTLKLLPAFLVLVLLSVPAWGQKHQPVIDMHMHIGAQLDLPTGAPAPCLPQPCIGKGQASANSADNLKKTLEVLGRYNILKGSH